MPLEFFIIRSTYIPLVDVIYANPKIGCDNTYFKLND